MVPKIGLTGAARWEAPPKAGIAAAGTDAGIYRLV
jgi:hypothetical protein